MKAPLRPSLRQLFLLLCLAGSLQTALSQGYAIDQTGVWDPEYSLPYEISIPEDDFSEELPLEFDFEFFGNVYSSVWMAQNGYLTFDEPTGPDIAYPQSLPDPNGPNNIIAGVWTDMDDCMYGGCHYYGTTGTAPFRVFNALYFNYNGCGNYVETEIKLFETTNIIEIHSYYENFIIIGLQEGAGLDCTDATQGIENADGTQAFYVFGRNQNSSWDAMEDFVAFIPTYPNDAGVLANITTYCDGPVDIKTIITNAGSNLIDSVKVNWTWNGVVQTPYDAQFPLYPGENALVTLGSKTLTFGDTDTLVVWTADPNGMVDLNNGNDTISSFIHPALHGTYTIGGTSPDYATFGAAVADLTAYGVCDSVIFAVRPGTYSEQVSVGHITGASNDHLVIFRAENGDSSSVVLQYASTNSSANYVLRLNNAHNVIFEKMTITSLATTYARVIDLSLHAYDNIIRHCAINGRNISSTSSIYACVYSSSSNDNFTLSHNTISNGSYGFYHSVSGSLSPVGLRIEYNRFLNPYYRGIVTSETRGLRIHGNTITTSTSSARGIEVDEENDSLTISNNIIDLANGSQGISLTYVHPDNGGTSRIFNNMISARASNASAGVYLYNVSHLHFYQNAVYIANNSTFSYPLEVTSSSLDSFYNNILYNGGGGPVVYSQSVFGNSFDYNCYYTTGSEFGQFISTSNHIDDFEEWQETTGYDEHSLFLDPYFTSTSDLHVSNSFLNAAGSALFSDLVDIDNETRNVSAPDIGADEFTPPGTDAAIAELLSPTKTCEEEQQVEVVLVNLGSDTLNSVTIEWSINSVLQDPVVLTPTLTPEGDTLHVVLGSAFFSNDIDTIRVWSSMPNGMTDLQPLNDTLEVFYRLPLQGTFSIGGTDPDFSSMTHAIKAMEKYTICGPCVFQFRNGTYSAQVELDSITGVSASNTITFESESGDTSSVTLTASGQTSTLNYVIKINQVDYVTFRNLKFSTSNNISNGNILVFENDANHITIEGNAFVGRLNTTSGNLVFISGASGEHDYTIVGNTFLNGTSGITFNGGFPVNAGDHTITDNVFLNQYSRGLRVSYQDNCLIEGNVVTKTVTNATSYTGIDVDYIFGNSDIRNNVVLLQTGGTPLDVNTSNNFVGDVGSVRIYNNMLYTSDGVGLRLWNSVRPKVYYNNVYTAGPDLSDWAFELVGGDTTDVRNNNFIAAGGRAITNLYSTPTVMTSDYNNLYTQGTEIGYWAETSYTDLMDWQSGTGLDGNSMSVDPQFVTTTDLHVLADTLDGAATPIAGVTTDFDGQPRNSITPDIGADEIGANSDDAGVFAVLPEMPFARGIQDIKAVIRNYGGNPITHVDVHWTLDGLPQPTFSYSQTLESLEQDTVTLGSSDFLLATPYDIVVWTADPNSVTDAYNNNDTLRAEDLYAAVSDVVTVGGSAPDVLTPASAVQAMLLGGVLDSVLFSIRSGTYNGAISIPQHDQLNCETPVVFESESGLAGDVILENMGIPASTMTLDGADGITFRNITIRNTLSGQHAVDVHNGSHCNTFDHCVLEGVSVNSTNASSSTVYSAAGQDTANTFISNTIKNGSYGVYWRGDIRETGFSFINNTIQNQYYIGFYLDNQDAPIVTGNTLTTTSTHSNITGFYLNDCDNAFDFSSNKILLPGRRSTGVTFNLCNGTTTERSLVSNNFIRTGNASASTGIYFSSSTYSDIFYNTVKVEGSNTASATFYEYAFGETYLSIRNNLFYSSSGGYAMYFYSTNSNDVSDYNDLFTTGPTLVRISGNTYADLAAWQATGMDSHSLTEDPIFEDGASFRPTAAALNESGEVLTRVTTDIEGDARDAVSPDIGCDEFNLFTDDVGLVAINYPVQPFPSGENTVFIKFVNNGQDTLTTMQVDWEVDGVLQPTYSWTGLLPSAGTYDSLDIGIYDFAPYQTHSVKVWVSNPNGMTDGLASNDTLLITGLYPGLAGVYTIGGIEPDFDSLGQAIHVLTQGGAADAVTFNIRSGTYLETMYFTEFPGGGCDRPVVFRSENGDSSSVVVTNLGIDAYPLTLDGADGLTFEHLTLESVNPAFRRVVEFNNGAHCNQFNHNYLKGYEASSASTSYAVVYSNTSIDTANAFRNNRIEFGSYAMYIVGGTGTLTHTVVEGNQFVDNYSDGLYAHREGGIRVNGNSIGTSTYTSRRGIELSDCDGAIEVTRNKVMTGSGQYGLYVNGCDATSDAHGLIANNFLSVGGTGVAHALYVNNSNYLDLFYNSSNTYTTNGTPANSTGLAVNGGGNITLYNNIGYAQSPGYAILVNGVTNLISDYNDFFATASLGLWNGSSQPNLAAWQSASGGDANSVSSNPQYMSNTDLHVANAVLNEAGLVVSVTIDIDGETRGATPDIGADEFTPAANDDAGAFAFNGPLAPFASGGQPVAFTLKNFGGNTLTSADVRWIVNGIEQTAFAWSGALAPGGCDTVTIGSYDFAEYTPHEFVIWTEMPNGVPDSTNINDTLHVVDVYPALSGVYTVGGVLPDFNLFTQLQDAINQGGILDDVYFDIRNGTYSTQFTLEDFPRVSESDEVTFRSVSGDSTTVTIVRDFNASYNHTIRLNGARKIRFEHVTLKTTQGRILDIGGGSSGVTITGCRLQGVQFPSSPSAHQLVYSNSTTEDTLYVIGNRFEFGAYGLYLNGSNGARESGLLVEKNVFFNCYSRAIEANYQTQVRIDDNTFFNDTKNGYSPLYLTRCDHTLSVSGNTILSEGVNTSGMYLYQVTGTEVAPALFANNFIHMKGGTGTVYGINHNGGDYNNFYHNTIRIDNSQPNSTAFLDDNSYHHIEMKNCILANMGGGKAITNSWSLGFFSNVMDYCDLYTTGPVLAHWFNDIPDLSTLQGSTNTNLNSTDAEPLFAETGYKVFQADLEDAGTALTQVTTDIEGEVRSGTTPDIGCDEFVLLPNDIGIKALLSPETYCGLSATETVLVRVQNFGSSPQTGFDVAYSFNGAAWTVENVGAASVPAGGILDFEFASPVDLSLPDSYNFDFYTSLAGDQKNSNDTLFDVEVVHIPALTSPVTNMLPVDGTTGLNKPVSLSWAPAPNATGYDVYVWENGSSQPGSPQISNTAQINTLYQTVTYGHVYNWRVVARNVCNQTVPGPIQQFTIRDLPDVVVDTVIIPATAFSGQQIEVEWQTRNTGIGSTQGTLWSDAVYLSTDATLNTSFDTYLGAVPNLTALESGEAYTNTGTFTVPNGLTGNFYVFVYADRYNSLTESENNNNWERSPGQMQITLTPSPDLVVDNIVIPSSGFSGQLFPVSFTVRNNGFGPAQAMEWRDLITIQPGGNLSKLIKRTTPLQPDSSYTVTTSVILPEAVFGEFQLIVITDALGQVYEFGAENNNELHSDTFDIFLTPPPDLVPVAVDIPDTVSSNQVLSLNWWVENEGATGPTAEYWTDRVYISPSPIFNQNFNTTLITKSKSRPLAPGDQYALGGTARIPAALHGNHYLYVFTDYTDKVFEYTYESNNIYRTPGIVYVASPDLKGDSLTGPAMAQSGANVFLSYQLVNVGLGDLIERAHTDSFYLSADQVLDPGDYAWYAVQRSASTGSLPRNDTLTRSQTLPLPQGLTGTYYIIVKVDAKNQIYENGSKSNNSVASLAPVQILPAPWPDLIPVSIMLADTITAGETYALSYDILNQGGIAASTLGQEAVYYSFSPVWDPELATKLFAVNRAQSLAKDSVLRVTWQPTLPAHVTSNVYYFYVGLDEGNVLFEDANEGNNIQRSAQVFVKGYPPVDLALDSVHVPLDTLESGYTYQLNYVIRNAGSGAPRSLQWNDRAYLSVDSVFNPEIDLLLGTRVTEPGALPAGDTTLQKKLFTIPNGTTGDYYLFVEVDAGDVNMDVNRQNNVNLVRHSNGTAKKIHVKLSVSPDLTIALFTAPTVAVTGQNVSLGWSVKNVGTGFAYSWVDRLYLSSDQTIGFGDILLLERKSSLLNPGDSTTVDTTLFLPANLNGNYVLILQTDAKNVLYEHNGEHNNIAQRSIQIDQPPPSDLFVSSVTVPANAIAGDNATISWSTVNQGAYLAYGQLREIVYLSKDQVLDVNDALFAIKDGPVYIAPAGVRADTQTAPVLDVEVGDYYALVQTDARNAIYENNDTNNVTASLDLMNVDVNRLYLDYLTADTLVNQKELYYKVNIPAASQGSSLSIELFGDTLVSANELYVSYEDMPTRAEFDAGYSNPNASYQRVVISHVQPGTYYILAYGHSDTSLIQHVDLFARLINFELISVAPKKASNEGWATLTLKGANLDSTLEVRLTDTAFNYYIADTFRILDDQTIVARFDLRGVPAGDYTIEATRAPDLIATIQNGFTVLEEGGSDLQITYRYSPESFFQNRVTSKLIVEAINNGENDVENVSFRLESPAGEQLAASLESYQNGLVYQVVLEPIGQDNGFGHVLPPGGTFRLEYIVRVQPYPLVAISIVKND